MHRAHGGFVGVVHISWLCFPRNSATGITNHFDEMFLVNRFGKDSIRPRSHILVLSRRSTWALLTVEHTTTYLILAQSVTRASDDVDWAIHLSDSSGHFHT